MSACLHQPRNVSGRIPRCGRIRLHAALTDNRGSCARTSRIIRFARYPISSLNFLGAGTKTTRPVAPEPPSNPEHFKEIGGEPIRTFADRYDPLAPRLGLGV
jgi:hypothetical protein